MKCRWLIVCMLLSVGVGAVASDSCYIASERITTLRGGYMRSYDQYLSPVMYSGWIGVAQTEWWQPLHDSAWWHVGTLSAGIGRQLNQAHSNGLYNLSAGVAWGAFYRYPLAKGLHLLAGAQVDLDFWGQLQNTSVNKPYSMDLAWGLSVAAGLSYSFAARKTHFRLRYRVSTPFFGGMVVPEYGEAYYELLTNRQHLYHTTSFHNRQVLRHELTFDTRFRHSTWRIGVVHEYYKYRANNLSFSREQVSLSVGTMFTSRLFGGRRRPANYITVW